MLISIVGATPAAPSPLHFSACNPLLRRSLFPGFGAARTRFLLGSLLRSGSGNKKPVTGAVSASLIEAPLLWAGRLCVFYALLKAGLAGSEANPLVSGSLESCLDPSFLLCSWCCRLCWVLMATGFGQSWRVVMGSVVNLVIWDSPSGSGACRRNQVLLSPLPPFVYLGLIDAPVVRFSRSLCI